MSADTENILAIAGKKADARQVLRLSALLGLLAFFCLSMLPMQVTAAEQKGAAGNTPATTASVETIGLEGLQEVVTVRNGKPLVLVYWASWCVPCRHFKEKLAELRERFPASDVDIIGLSVDTDPAMLDRYLKEAPLPYHTFRASAELYTQLAGLAVPTTVIYDAQGKPVHTLTGDTDIRRLSYFVRKSFRQSPE